MTTALDQVMAEAETAAQAIVPVPVPAPGNAAGLAPYQPANTNLAKPSMDSFLDAGGMDVEEYLRVKPEGFRIGDKMKLIEELVAEIDLNEVTPVYCCRYEVSGQTSFIKSYDGQSTHDGKNFQAEVDRLGRVAQKCTGAYPTVEVPFSLTEEVKSGSITFDEGTRVGYTPSVTGFKPFQSFMRKIRSTNPELLNATVRVKLTHEKRVKGSNEWGVVNFELLGD